MSSFTVTYIDAFGSQQVVSDLSEAEADAVIEKHGNGTRLEFAHAASAR